jgi:ubiquitin carboxyl-terminal hydrolase 4/11
VRNRKVDTFVDYPVKDLDLTDRIGDKEWLNEVSEGQRLMYDLFAVAKHSGGLYGGHYTADVCNYLDGHWYDFNGSSLAGHDAEIDTWVQPARLDKLVNASALLLFYKRKSRA